MKFWRTVVYEIDAATPAAAEDVWDDDGPEVASSRRVEPVSTSNIETRQARFEPESLALYFTPDAIQQHFEGDVDDVAARVADASDAELYALGEWCIGSDALHREFRRLLIAGVEATLMDAVEWDES